MSYAVLRESLQKAEAAAQQAIRLDPNHIDGYTALALARNFRGLFVQAEDLYKQALSLDPGNPDALHQYGLMLAIVGRSKDSLAMRLRLRAQEPLVPIFNQITATVLWENGRNDEAIEILKASPQTFVPRLYLARVYASMGRYSEAADALLDIPTGVYLPGAVEEAIRLLRTAPAQTASPQTIPIAGALGFVHLYAGAPDRVLDFFEGLAEAGVPALGNLASFLWAPGYAPVRKTERFKAPSCERRVSSIIGVCAAGPNSAARWAPTISSADRRHSNFHLWTAPELSAARQAPRSRCLRSRT